MTRLDLLVVGALAVDRVDDDLRPGGAVLYATEAAAAGGWTVGVLTTAGVEPAARDGLRRLQAAARAVEGLPTERSVRFRHEARGGRRRLTLEEPAAPIGRLGAAADWQTRALLLAPVAGEVTAPLVAALVGHTRPSVVASAVQGWLRTLDAGARVEALSLAAVSPEITAVVRGLDIVVASIEDVGVPREAALAALARMREWAGPRPELIVTAGVAGALVDDGSSRAIPVPRRVVGVDTTGAGDALAALVTARRAAGESLDDATRGASEEVSALLALRRRGDRAPGGRSGART